ncbi:MAG: hypothetical protein ACK5L3_08530 [Oscillospiraceae bacterium]
MKKFKLVRVCNGAISIFLILLLLPILSVATIIVEGSRMQNALLAFDQAMQLAGMSTLASYDDDLLSRFGLLAVSQQEDVGNIYNAYLKQNADGMDGLFSMEGQATVTGLLDLTDTDIMMRQIAEYEKLRLPTDLGFYLGGMGIDAILDKFGDYGKAADKSLGALQGGMEAVEKGKDLQDAVEALNTAFENLRDAYEKLSAPYYTFLAAVNDLIQYRIDNDPPPAEPQEDASQEERDAYEEYQDKITAAEAAQTEYLRVLGVMCLPGESVLDKFVEKYNKVFEAHEKLTKAMADMVDGFESAGNALSGVSSEPGKSDVSVQMDYIQTISGITDKILKDFDIAEMNGIRNQYTAVRQKVAAFDCGNVSPSTLKIELEGEYWVNWSGVGNKEENLKDFIAAMSQEQRTDDISASLTAMFEMLTSLFDLTLVADPRLNFELSAATAASMPYSSGGNPSANAMAASWSLLQEAINDTIAAFNSTGLMAIGKILVAMAKLVAGFVAFLAALITLIAEKVAALFTLGYNIGTGDFANNLFLAHYAFSEFSSRVSRKSSAYLPNPLSAIDSIGAIVGSQSNFMNQDYPDVSTRVGLAFASAEQEYVLYKNESEIVNQTMAFFDIWIVRILINIPTVMMDKGITKLADAIPVPGLGMVFRILMMLLEGLADTLLLVNGGDVGLWKKEMYFSAGGFAPESIASVGDFSGADITRNKSFFDRLKSVLDKKVAESLLPEGNIFSATDEERQAIKDKEEKDKNENRKNKDVFDVDYNFHLFLLMSIFSPLTTQVKLERISNVVHMEMNYLYAQQGRGSYQLGNAYTQIQASATATLDQIFVLPSALGKFTNEEYMGY